MDKEDQYEDGTEKALDEVSHSNRANLIFTLILILMVGLVVSFANGSGSGDELTFNSDNITVVFSEDETLIIPYSEIIAAEYLDYLPGDVVENSLRENNIYQGKSKYNGQQCWCYLSKDIEGACLIFAENATFLFNIEDTDTTEALSVSLSEIAQEMHE